MQKVYDSIAAVEQDSSAEIVVIKHPQADSYLYSNLMFAMCFMVAVYTVLMYIPIEIDSYLIYIFTILSLPLGFAIVHFLKPLKRLMISKKLMNRKVEIYARALFQKGRLHLTLDHTGILVYCSDFEKMVMIIADNGVEISVPKLDMDKILDAFNDVYKDDNFEENLCKGLAVMKDILKVYLPAKEPNFNEIPDDLTIVL